MQPRASPFTNTGIRSVCASSASACSPCAQYRSVPAMITGRSAPRKRPAASSTASAGAPLPTVLATCDAASSSGSAASWNT